MNINRESWEVLLGLKKHNIPYAKSPDEKNTKDYLSTKNLYSHSDSFVNEIRELLKNPNLKHHQMYNILLEQKKMPVTRLGKVMAKNTFNFYVIGLREEMGLDARSYSKRAQAKKLIESGLKDPIEIASKLDMEVRYVKSILRTYLNKLIFNNEKVA